MSTQPSDETLLLRNGRVHDGEGWLGLQDVVVRDGVIAEIRPPSDARPVSDPAEVDLSGFELVPGFVDIHGMDVNVAAVSGKDARNLLAQGVTTLVVGNCGVGEPTGGDHRLALNVVELAGHNGGRNLLSAQSQGPAGEIELLAWVDQKLTSGARGVSLGLMYEPGRSADLEELSRLASIVQDHDAVLAVHLRDEGAGLIDSIDEILSVRGTARTVVMHLKACGPQNWGLLDPARERLISAGVRWTYYPYTDTNTRLVAADPALIHLTDGEKRERFLRDQGGVERLRESGLQTLARDGWAGVIVTRGPEDWCGESVSDLAGARGLTVEQFVIEALAESPDIRVRFKDVAELDGLHLSARHPLSLAASDGYVQTAGAPPVEHPRSFGAIARAFAWARDDKRVDDFLASMTSGAADLFGIRRGRIKVGEVADLVAVDMHGLRDNATYDRPELLATGVSRVWVRGRAAFAGGTATADFSGQLL